MDSVHTPQWLERLQSANMWYCDVDPLEHRIFPSALELEQHVKSDHDSVVPAIALATMLKQNITISSRGSHYCPICDEIVDPTRDEQRRNTDESLSEDRGPEALSSTGESRDDTIVSDRRFIVDHIAEDLRKLAFLSFQYLDGTIHREATEEMSEPTLDAEGNHLSGSTAPQWHARSNLDDISQLSPIEIGDNPQLDKEGHPLEPEPRPSSPVGFEQTPPMPRKPARSFRPRSFKDLSKLIRNYRVESAFDAQSFLPRDALEKLISRETVASVISKHHTDAMVSPRELADFIVSKAQAFFAILASFMRERDLTLAVSTLYRFKLTDQFLPISEETIDDNCEEDEGQRRCRHAPELNAFHEEPWDLGTLSSFHLRQWELLAPVFTGGFRIYHLGPRTILPFISVGLDRKTSLFSDVCEVEIHPAHLKRNAEVRTATGRGRFYGFRVANFCKFDNPTTRMALKELRSVGSRSATDSDIYKTFEAEVEVMEMMQSGSAPQNFLVAVAAIYRGGKRYLLFPWADGGDLRSLWSEVDMTWSRDRALVLEVLGEFLGVSDALVHLHESGFRHGDIKPDNILIFAKKHTNLGRLKLADMGLAKHHEQMTAERKAMTETKLATVLYEAPESQSQPNLPRSRLYDVWSLGCVFFEFAIWLAYGLDGLHSFYEALDSASPSGRSFYVIEKKDTKRKARLHPEFERCFEQVRRHPSCREGTALGDLISFVKTRMLAVSLPKRHAGSAVQPPVELQSVKDSVPSIVVSAPATDGPAQLESSSIARANASEVSAKLKYIWDQARADAVYLFPGASIQRGKLAFESAMPASSEPLGFGFRTEELGPLEVPTQPEQDHSQYRSTKVSFCGFDSCKMSPRLNILMSRC